MKTAFLSALCGALCWCATSTTATAHSLPASLDDAPRSTAVHSSSATALNSVTNATTGTVHSSIQEAIDAASAGDVISLAAGTFNPSGQITVNKALSLTGAGSGSTTIHAGGTGYGVSISADDVHLEGFTLHGAATFGVKASGVSNFSLQDVAAINGNNSAIDLNGVSGATLTDISASNTALGYGLAISSSSDVTVNGITTSSNAFGAIGIFPAQPQYQAAGLEAPSNISIGGSVSLNGGAGAVTVQNGALASGGTWVGTVSNDAADNADVTVPVGFTHAVFSTRNDGLTGQSIASQAVIAGLVAYGAANPIPGVTYEDVYVYDMEEGDYEVFAPLLIQDAIDAASAGDAITVAAGTYAESLTLDKGLSLDGNGATLDVSGLAVGISIQSDVDGVTLDNLTIVGDASTYSGITVNPGASNVSLLNNNISGMALSNPGNSSPLSYGILCWGNADPINPPSNILIEGNEIHGVSGTAISLGDNTEGVTISNNHFHDIAQVLVNGAPWSSGVVAGQANNLAITGNNMEGLAYASALTACTGVTLDANQYSGGTATMLLASLPNSFLPDATDWWSLEAAAIGYIYYFNSAAAQALTDAGLQAAGIPTTLSSSNPGCMESTACNYDSTALTEDNSCTYPVHPDFDCDGNCNNDADGDGICDELEGLLPELEEACGQGTVWDAALGQCLLDTSCIGDLDFDGAVTSTDLLYMLVNFGSFCAGADSGE